MPDEKKSGPNKMSEMSSKHGGHISDDALERYAYGRLPDELITPLEEHLLICEACQARLEQLEQFIHIGMVAAQEVRSEQTARRSRARSWWDSWLSPVPKQVWAGAFAAVVLAAVIIPFTGFAPGSVDEAQLVASRDSGDLPRVRAGNVAVKIDTAELNRGSAYLVQLVDLTGKEIWKGSLQATGGPVRVAVGERLSRDQYLIRLYENGDPAPIKEYGLMVK